MPVADRGRYLNKRDVANQRKGESNMINSNVYDYINVLDRAADASWKRNEAIANNIANVDTPGYKRQDVEFEEVLRRELRDSRYTTVDAKVSGLDMGRLEGKEYIDSAAFSYRMDGNNVDIDTENTQLAANQIKYNALVNSVNQEFARLTMVMK